MKKDLKLPRILKIQSVKGWGISCIFNSGETRIINFEKLFAKWKLSKADPGYRLQDAVEFKKVKLRNQTLSWPNIPVSIIGFDGKVQVVPFEIGPDVLYAESEPAAVSRNQFFFGSIVKALRLERGLSQEELAQLSGTSKTYISRVENDLIEPELRTLYKIVELGLKKKIRIEIA
jgi:DNA-binding XRE family transcriptional regulator